MTLTKDGKASPLGAIDRVRVLNWHGDTFDLPVGATRLASTKITPNQAFAHGPRVLALQFHVELPGRDMEWLIGHTWAHRVEGRSRQDSCRDGALRPPPTRSSAVQRLAGRAF
jgi:GMP synthase-like glutamine amidotransferase